VRFLPMQHLEVRLGGIVSAPTARDDASFQHPLGRVTIDDADPETELRRECAAARSLRGHSESSIDDRGVAAGECVGSTLDEPLIDGGRHLTAI